MKRLIIYISPGHQCSEYIPWLINHSPDVTHGRTYDATVFSTEYSSSWGSGFEPLESQWTLCIENNPSEDKEIAKDKALLYSMYKKFRLHNEFVGEFFEKYMKYWNDDGNRCLFFNIRSPDDYEEWVSRCRDWFAATHPEVSLLFAGHTMDLLNVQYPSIYFLKEGYVLDEHEHTREWTLTSPASHSVIKQLFKQKVLGRFNVLDELYKKLDFDFVFGLSDLEDRSKLKRCLSRIIRLPDNIDELADYYWSRNPIDQEVDTFIKKIIKEIKESS